MGGTKRAKQFFQKHTNSGSKKCWGKIRRKKCEKRFLYSHDYRDQKMGGQKLAIQFLQKHTNSAFKKCWGKIVEKSAKNLFLYSHEYRDQKMGAGKKCETIFPETHKK